MPPYSLIHSLPYGSRRSLHIGALGLLALMGLGQACSGGPESNGPLGGKSTDENGDGVADGLGVLVQTDAAEYQGKAAIDTDGDGMPDGIGLDTDADGVIDAVDTDFDGKPDVKVGGTSGSGTSATTDSDDGSDSSSGDSDTSGDSGLDLTTGSPPPEMGGNGTPEVCDGVDNDENGIIDDVDVGGDGICDCLRIGTLGSIGPWSDGGNIFREWLEERSSTPALEVGHARLTQEILDQLDVLVVLRVDESPLDANGISDPAHPSFSDEEVAAFDAWLRAGGGALTTLGYTGNETAEMVNVNRLLSLSSPGYSEDVNLDGFITDWADHPISEGVSNINNTNGVVADDSSGTVVARDANGKPALVVHEVEAGRVIVWGDEWITYDSEWQADDEQQVELLWLNMLKYLSPMKTCQVPIPPDILR